MQLVKFRRFFFLVLIAIFLIGEFRNTYADTLEPPVVPQYRGEGWFFEFAPYGWFTSLSGDVTIDGYSEHVSLPFSEVWDHLDFAAQGHVEAGYKRLVLMIDPTYVKLSAVDSDGEFTASDDFEMVLVDAGAFYRLISTPATYKQHASLEGLAGVRYIGLFNQLEITPIPINVNDSVRLLAPIFGGRVKYSPTRNVHFWARGDGGGFNIDGMHSTWSATAGVSYTIHRYFDVGVAYRVLGFDYEKPKSAMNMVMYGPMAGVSFHPY